MGKQAITFSFTLLIILFSFLNSQAQNPVNWTGRQLMEPSALVEELKNTKDLPSIISVGPGAPVPHSVHIGMVNDTGNLQKLNDHLAGLSKNKKVVVYCGCCPFEHCPNVRPAIDALKKLGFTNYFLLNLPKNIKTDWIDKGYPVSD